MYMSMTKGHRQWEVGACAGRWEWARRGQWEEKEKYVKLSTIKNFKKHIKLQKKTQLLNVFMFKTQDTF